MRKFFLILLLIPFLTKGQEAVIHFSIANATVKHMTIINEDCIKADVLFGERNIEVPLIEGKANWKYKFSYPVFVKVQYHDEVTKKYFVYDFYLSPGDNLNFSVDANNPQTSYAITGKGSENNQPLIQQLHDSSFRLDHYKKDSLPGNVLKAIKVRDIQNRRTLENYIAAHHPTKDFVRSFSLFIQYFPLWTYINFKGSQKYNIPKPFFRNEDKWQAIEDSLTNAIPVSNDEVLRIPNYAYFLPTYLTRIKERLWSRPELLKEYFETDNPAKILNEDPENLLREKIITKLFTAKTAEYLYAVLFKESISENEDNLPAIFARFKQEYPQSQYTSYIKPAIVKIEERRNRKLTDKMILIENSDSIETFDDVLKLVQGKTVLLDMWGTWCGPCRSELLQNSDSIKNHFKDKALDYLYIANYDIGKEGKWKNLISYYNLTGTHILANKNLTKSIMERVKGTGYPTYVIIKKDGTFELSKSGYPMERGILYEQLEKALND